MDEMGEKVLPLKPVLNDSLTYDDTSVRSIFNKCHISTNQHKYPPELYGYGAIDYQKMQSYAQGSKQEKEKRINVHGDLQGLLKGMPKALADRLYSFSEDKEDSSIIKGRVLSSIKGLREDSCVIQDGVPVFRDNLANKDRGQCHVKLSSHSPENVLNKLIGLSGIFCPLQESNKMSPIDTSTGINGLCEKRRYTLPLVQNGRKKSLPDLPIPPDKASEKVSIARCKYSIDAILEKSENVKVKDGSPTSEMDSTDLLDLSTNANSQPLSVMHSNRSKINQALYVPAPSISKTTWATCNNIDGHNNKNALNAIQSATNFNNFGAFSMFKPYPTPYYHHPLNNYLFNALTPPDYNVFNNGFSSQALMYKDPYQYYLLNLLHYNQHGFVPRASPYYIPSIHQGLMMHGSNGNSIKKSHHHETSHSHQHKIQGPGQHKNKHNRQLEAKGGGNGDNVDISDPNGAKATKKRGSKIQFFNDWRLERDKCGRFTKQNNYTSHRKELLEKLRKGITLRCELCGQTFHSLKGYIDHENKLPCMRRSTSSGKKRGRPRKVGDELIPSSPSAAPLKLANKVARDESFSATPFAPMTCNPFQEGRNGVIKYQSALMSAPWLTSPTNALNEQYAVDLNKDNYQTSHFPSRYEVSNLLSVNKALHHSPKVCHSKPESTKTNGI